MAQLNTATAMTQLATMTPFDYLIVVGDNIYEKGVDSVTSPRWQATFEDVYTDASLQVPWHVIAGNHDQLCVVRFVLRFVSYRMCVCV